MDPKHNATGSRLREYLQLLSDRRRMILLVAAAAFVFGIFLSVLLPKNYRAQASVEIHSSGRQAGTWERFHSSSSSVRLSSVQYFNTELAILSGRENLYRVVDLLDLSKRWENKNRQQALFALSRKIEVRLRQYTHIIDIEAVADSPGEAAEIANAVAYSYVEKKEAERQEHSQRALSSLRSQLEQQQKKIQDLEREVVEVSLGEELPSRKFTADKLNRSLESQRGILLLIEKDFRDAGVKGLAAVDGARIHERAESVTRISSLNAWIVIPAVGALLLLSGFGLALWNEKRPVWKRDVFSVIEKKLNTGPVTLVPQDAGILISDLPPYGHRAEPYRDLRTRFERRYRNEYSRLVCVVAPERGEGGAEASVNLASVFADAGHTVLLIDADMRQPSIHEVFHAAHHPGLSDYLSGEMRIEETVVKAAYPNLWFIPSGPRHVDPCRLLTCKRMDDLVTDMKSRFDYVFIHSPAMDRCSDATAIVGCADDTLLVATHGKHHQHELVRAKKLIEAAGGDFSGLVLTGVETEPGRVTIP